MAWQVQKQYLDKSLGHHVVHLHDPSSGAEHVLQIIVSHDACAVCGHVKPKSNTDELNPKQIIEEEIKNLEAAHAQSHGYAQKHGVPILRADGKAR